jgi:hypothetical protein
LLFPGQIKGNPFPGAVVIILIMELIMVAALIFVPTLQSVGKIGKGKTFPVANNISATFYYYSSAFGI